VADIAVTPIQGKVSIKGKAFARKKKPAASDNGQQPRAGDDQSSSRTT